MNNPLKVCSSHAPLSSVMNSGDLNENEGGQRWKIRSMLDRKLPCVTGKLPREPTVAFKLETFLVSPRSQNKDLSRQTHPYHKSKSKLQYRFKEGICANQKNLFAMFPKEEQSFTNICDNKTSMIKTGLRGQVGDINDPPQNLVRSKDESGGTTNQANVKIENSSSQHTSFQDDNFGAIIPDIKVRAQAHKKRKRTSFSETKQCGSANKTQRNRLSIACQICKQKKEKCSASTDKEYPCLQCKKMYPLNRYKVFCKPWVKGQDKVNLRELRGKRNKRLS